MIRIIATPTAARIYNQGIPGKSVSIKGVKMYRTGMRMIPRMIQYQIVLATRVLLRPLSRPAMFILERRSQSLEKKEIKREKRTIRKKRPLFSLSREI
jgi:hypothetical protein